MEPRFYMESIHVYDAVGVAVALYVLTLIFEATKFFLIVLVMPWIAAMSNLIWLNISFTNDKELAEEITKSE